MHKLHLFFFQRPPCPLPPHVSCYVKVAALKRHRDGRGIQKAMRRNWIGGLSQSHHLSGEKNAQGTDTYEQ